jgi:transcriptional regulator with XRE-family HTH domain
MVFSGASSAPPRWANASGVGESRKAYTGISQGILHATSAFHQDSAICRQIFFTISASWRKHNSTKRRKQNLYGEAAELNPATADQCRSGDFSLLKGAEVMAGSRDVASGTPHPVDVHVGQRLRQRRVAVGLTQDRLAKSVGITFQQVQKYERGTNRIVASRLFELAQVLKVSVEYFFDGLDPETHAPAPAPAHPGDEVNLPDVMGERETLLLVRAYHKIGDTLVRRRLVELVKSLSEHARRK